MHTWYSTVKHIGIRSCEYKTFRKLIVIIYYYRRRRKEYYIFRYNKDNFVMLLIPPLTELLIIFSFFFPSLLLPTLNELDFILEGNIFYIYEFIHFFFFFGMHSHFSSKTHMNFPCIFSFSLLS